MQNPLKTGIIFSFITAFVSGCAVFINKFGVGLFDSSSIYTAAKNIIVALLLTALVVGMRKLPELRTLSRRTWGKLALVGLIGGSIPFLLFFKALTMLPAVEAAFIHKTLFLWVALLAVPFLKEKLGAIQITALSILFLGVFLMGNPTSWSFGTGFILALVATMLWAVENVIAKKVLSDVSAITVGWARMFFGSLFLLAYLALTGNLTGLLPATVSGVGILLVASLALSAYVVTWYTALKYAPATVVSSVLVLAAPITAILNAVFVTHTFPTGIVLPTAMMLLGVILLSDHLRSYAIRFVTRLRVSH